MRSFQLKLASAGAGLELPRLAAEVRSEFPKFRIITKESSPVMHAVDIFLRAVTFNRMRSFMTAYVTTLGYRIYVPSTWGSRTDYSRCVTLRHERVHMRQRRRYGFIIYAARYLCWPLPVVFAVGRRNLEMEAYEESMRAYAEYFDVGMLQVDRVRNNMVQHFVSADYLWMWPFRNDIERWYNRTLSDIELEIVSQQRL